MLPHAGRCIPRDNAIREGNTVSTFYVLPPRPLLGRRFADFLQAILPGPEWKTTNPAVLAETLGSALMQIPDVFVLHREDLPEGEATAQALADGFGAAE